MKKPASENLNNQANDVSTVASTGDTTSSSIEAPKSSVPVIGIGASAGGLEAFMMFFDAMPPNSDLAFVLIQHLDPDHKSLTAELLARHTLMPVHQVDDQMRIEPNQVYVIPPNQNLSVHQGILQLSKPLLEHGLRMPIDFFFRTLAEDQRENAVCIILSGTGSDGTLGLKAIKSNGGLVLAQSPETAQFDGMPRSAINTGMVDYSLPVAEIPLFLIQYQQNVRQLYALSHAKSFSEEQLASVLSALHAQTHYDFSSYTKGTLTRRVERRMGLHHLLDVADYVNLVQQDNREARLLFLDLLISVTDFFREPEAYQQLGSEVIRKVIQAKAPEEAIRVWIPGCATGEEAYSMAMVILEQLQAAKKRCPVQIFASDIDEQALAIARSGLYPINIATDVSPERLRQFFVKKDRSYQVTKALRDCVVFAVQNLIGDPPFSRVDVISCRNLLIYLEPAVQKSLIAMFHFVLNDDGYLFLGSSETIGQHGDLFRPVSKKLRLYQRIGPTRSDKVNFPGVSELTKPRHPHYEKRPSSVEMTNFGKITQQFLLKHYSPFAVLINPQFEILYLYGQSGPYLELTTGKPTQDLISMVREGLRSKLRAAVRVALADAQNAEVRTRVKRDGKYYPVLLKVLPVKVPAMTLPKAADNLLVVTFSEIVEIEQPGAMPLTVDELQNATLLHQLENELADAKEYLRSVIEDVETSNEDLKVSHEEVLSMNEELQSSNEELETSREELQSLNEELTTVNSQLQNKVEELANINDDLENLLTSTEIAALFLDLQFCIKRFTPAMCALFNLINSDLGRPISDISHRFVNLNLLREAESAVKDRTTSETEVRTTEGKYFIMRISPFRTNVNAVEGVVVTFIDITRLKQIETSLSQSKERIELLLKSTGEAIYGVDAEGKCIFVNTKLQEDLGFTEDELIGRNLHPIFHHSRTDGSPYSWEECFIYRCLENRQPHQGGHSLIWCKDGTSFPILYSIEPIIELCELTGAVVIFRDMTNEHKLNHQARHDSLTGLINRREFEERLERVLETVQQGQDQHILCYLDLDQFKIINDTCGHLAGDELLRQLSAVLQTHVRKRDTLARLGGDEFGVLMEHCDQREGKRVANAMRDAVADYRFVWQGHTHIVGISIGLVSISGDGRDMTDLLKAADSACYAAKENGRNRIHVFSEQDTEQAARHGEMKWVARINLALDDNRFRLALQPIVPINRLTGGKIAYEVLIRMQDNDQIIQPNDFLGAAERYNLSSKLDSWVIRTVFRWLTDKRQELDYVSLININLSGQSLGDQEFLNQIVKELKNNPIPAEKICFEITETAAITNFSSVNRFMHAVKQLGCVFALDDFGTGLSSFEYLKALPVEYLKISGLFVKNIATNSIDFAMVKAINDLGHEMSKRVIAESVESEQILDCLVKLGVDYAQGYFVGKPIMLSDLKLPRSDATSPALS